MNQILKTNPGLQARRLAAVLLALAAPAAGMAQAFNNNASVQNPTATSVSAENNPTGGFYRISNLYGIGGTVSTDVQFTPVDLATVSNPDPSIITTANARYLNRLGQFTFANDYPITGVTLDMTAHSIYDINGNTINSVDRSAFLLHDFSLLFVGNNGAEFLISRITPLLGGGSRPSADEEFHLSMGSGDRVPLLQYKNSQDAAPAAVPVGREKVTSLEWLTGELPNGDLTTWDTGGEITYEDDTFPVNGDVTAPVPEPNIPNFNLVKSGQLLYAAGGGETTWNVYLFSTGPLSAFDAQSNPTSLQLNFSQITITVTGLPESSHAIWGGIALLGTAEILRRRKRAA